MQRYEQLQDLSREHHQSLKMAKDLANLVKQGSDDEIRQSVKKLTDYYDGELEKHFQHEEQVIFSLFFKHYREHMQIAILLLKDHGAMRALIHRIKTQQPALEELKKELTDFALMLKDHTRMEERTLFPLVESLFTKEQLEAVLHFQSL